MSKPRDGYKMTEVGEIPNEWNIRKLNNVCPLQRGFDLTNTNICNGNYPVVYSNGISRYHNEFKAKGPGVITGRSGTIGKVTYVEKDYWPHNTSLWVTNFYGNNEKYIYYLLTSMRLNQYGSGTGVPTLNRNDLSNIDILVPTIEEQEKIAYILSAVDEQLDNVDALIEKNKELKKGLIQKLLTKGIGHTEFKKTEIGEIPVKWEVKMLGDIANYINGKAFKPSEWEIEGLPIIRIQNLNGVKEYNYYNKNIEDRYIINKGQLLFSWSGSRGTSFGPYIWNGNKAVLNQHIFKVELIDGINNMFGYYAFKHVTQLIEETAHGSAGLVHVTKGMLEKFKIGVPSLEEQEKIALIITMADKKIEEYQHKKIRLGESKKGLMQQLLTGKIRVV